MARPCPVGQISRFSLRWDQRGNQKERQSGSNNLPGDTHGLSIVVGGSFHGHSPFRQRGVPPRQDSAAMVSLFGNTA